MIRALFNMFCVLGLIAIAGLFYSVASLFWNQLSARQYCRKCGSLLSGDEMALPGLEDYACPQCRAVPAFENSGQLASEPPFKFWQGRRLAVTCNYHLRQRTANAR